MTNKNLPLDTIEALAWGSNLSWGFDKHPPMSAFFSEIFFQIFGAKDWAFYLLSQIFILVAFYFVFKLATEILEDIKLSLISVLLLEAIYFYNFTSPEFNVNICQLPFWALAVFYSWKIFKAKNVQLTDRILLGLFSALGFLSKYLFIYLLASLVFLILYLILVKKIKKFDFKYLITFEVFVILLVPHFIWLYENDFKSIFYAVERTELQKLSFTNHFEYPAVFLFKQLVLLIPFFFLIWLLIKRISFKINFKDKKLIFLIFVNILPLILIFITSAITGSKIRTMWMTPFYLFFGLFFVYLFQSQINLKKLTSFLSGFFFLFFLSPVLYSYVSISQKDKRTDYPGKEIAIKTQVIWNQDFNKSIEFVIGDEWKAGNLSYHLKSRPKWEGLNNNDILKSSSQFICIDDICLGRY